MASPYVREPWAGASAGTWSEAKYSRSDDSDKIEEILLCNVGGDVGMGINIADGFSRKLTSELHFYYNENQDFRESYDFKGEISPSITELEERDGVLK